MCVLIRRCVIVFGSFPTWISDPHRLVHHRDTTYWGYCIKDTSNFFSTWFIVIYIQDLVPPPLKKRHSGARHHQGWRLLLQEARIYALGTGGPKGQYRHPRTAPQRQRKCVKTLDISTTLWKWLMLVMSNFIMYHPVFSGWVGSGVEILTAPFTVIDLHSIIITLW